MASLQVILVPQVVIEVITRIREGQGRLSRLFGMNLGGKNVTNIDGRYATFRIFDHTREPAFGRAPGSGPATISNQPIGQVPVQMARFHEKKVLDYEQLGNLSLLAGPNSQVDLAGQDYIARQEGDMAERINSAIELMVAGMVSYGAFYLKMVGENFIPFLAPPTSGNYLTINFNVPAGNQNQLNFFGTGNVIDAPWSQPGTSILRQLMNLKAAFVQLHGRPLKDVLINSTTWYKLVTNTEIKNVGGSSITTFASYDQVKEKDMDGEETNAYQAVLRADPTITWHIIDDVLAIGGGGDPSYASGTATLVKEVPDNVAIFLPPLESAKRWTKMVHGSEPVVEKDGEMPQIRKGLYCWNRPVCQPSGIELISLLNAMPILEVPKSLAIGTIDGF